MKTSRSDAIRFGWPGTWGTKYVTVREPNRTRAPMITPRLFPEPPKIIATQAVNVTVGRNAVGVMAPV